jgi:DNA-binding CsgD family transcriptional regulator
VNWLFRRKLHLFLFIWVLTSSGLGLYAQNEVLPDSILNKISSPDSLTQIRGHLYSAGVYLNVNTNEALSRALFHTQKAEEISAAINYRKGMGVSCLLAGYVYDIQDKEIAKAYESYAKAANYLCADKEVRCAMAYYGMAVALGKLKRYDEACKMFELALREANKYRLEQEGSMWVSYAKYCDVAKNNYDNGRLKIRRALFLADSLNEPTIRCEALKLGSELEMASQKPTMAVAYVDELISIADTTNLQMLMEAYSLRSDAHKILGDYESAYRDFTRMHHLFTKIKDDQGTAMLKDAEARYETVKSQARVAELTAETRLKTIYLLAALTLLLSIAGLGLWQRYRLKIAKQSQRILAQEVVNRKLEAERAEELAVKLEAEKQAETEKNLRLETEKHTEILRHEYEERLMKEKLTEMSFRFDERRRLIEVAKDKIERRLDAKESAKVMEILESGLPDSDPWDDFKAYFDQVHEGFFTRLSSAVPDLTGAEARIAAFIRMNKPIKEAAEALNISPDSVKKTRYRLRKKLNLERDDNLTAFIMKL